MTSPLESTATDHDVYWKDAFDSFLPDFVRLFAPDVHAAVDWARGFTPRTAELFPESEQSATGKGYPDRLYEVHRTTGEVELLFLHFEFQSQPVRDFEERMFVYHLRLWLHLRQRIVSIALLADGDRGFRPTEYRSEYFEMQMVFRFRSIKLLDFAPDRERYAHSADPAKVLVAIKLIDLMVKDPRERFAEVMRVFRSLRSILKDRKLLPELTRYLIQGIMLPPPFREEFRRAVRAAEKESDVPFITVFEAEAKEQGKAEGRAEGRAIGQGLGRQDSLLAVLRARFGSVPDAVVTRVRSIDSIEQLDLWIVQAATLTSIEEFMARFD